MPSTRQQQKLLLAGILMLGFCVVWSSGIRCYVCGPHDETTTTTTTTTFNQTCKDFQLNVTLYEQQCPENHFGCAAHFEGTESKRECVRMRLNDCKKANNVDYCFCSSNLCNGITPLLQATDGDDDDDEDILTEGGSGAGKPLLVDKTDINVIIQDVGGNSIVATIDTKESSAAHLCIAIHLLASTCGVQLMQSTF